MKKILLLSGYDASSHRYWRNALQNSLEEFEWTQLALPDRHFYWRVRSNSLSFALEQQELLNKDYDLIIATSMVDLSSLRGFVPKLASTATIVYFHENQFAYPVSAQQPNLVNVQITSIYSAVCADSLIFNSNYNRRSFFDGAKALLKRMPDHVPKGIIKNLTKKSTVIPVPIEIPFEAERTAFEEDQQVPQIIWNHRWEYDKQPEVFFEALKLLKNDQIGFKLHLLGQSFRNKPECFAKAKVTFKDEILTSGYQQSGDYYRLLKQADIVVSSALHDFQGLSMLQAIAYGCIPIAPNRLVYPEYIPQQLLYDVASDQNNDKTEAENLACLLQKQINHCCSSKNNEININIHPYSIEHNMPLYRQHFENLIH